MIRTFILCAVLCIASMITKGMAQDSVMVMRQQSFSNDCLGQCYGTSYSSIRKVTMIVSTSTVEGGALANSSVPSSQCSLAVSFMTRTCLGSGGTRMTDILPVAFCTTCPDTTPDVNMVKMIARALVPDDPLGIIDPLAGNQIFRWIFPSCWYRTQCAFGSGTADWACFISCECVQPPPYLDPIKDYCLECCVINLIRFVDGSCNLVTLPMGNYSVSSGCPPSNNTPGSFSKLPISGTPYCDPPGTGPCNTTRCPDLYRQYYRYYPTAP